MRKHTRSTENLSCSSFVFDFLSKILLIVSKLPRGKLRCFGFAPVLLHAGNTKQFYETVYAVVSCRQQIDIVEFSLYYSQLVGNRMPNAF